MDSTDSGTEDAVFVNENDAEEVIDLDNGNEIDDSASWVTENEVDILSGSEIDDEEDEEDNNVEGNLIRDDSVQVFRQHSSEVYCVCIDPVHCILAATGGKDDRAFVWNINDGQVLFECSGHNQSVVSVGFNSKSTLLASGDLDGSVFIWKIDTGVVVDHRQFSEIQWLKWHGQGDVLMIGTGSPDGTSGDIVLWDIPSGQERYLSGSGSTRCNTGKFLPDGKRAVAGYDSGVVKTWNLKTGACIHSFNAHRAPITAVDCHSDKDLVLSASVDNTASLLHTGTGQVLKIYANNSLPLRMDEGGDDVEAGVFAASFSPSVDFKFLATGTKSGLLTIWDYSTHAERVRCQHTAGIERLVWHPNGLFVYTCTSDGRIFLWDSRNGQELNCWLGHRKGIYDVDLSRNGNHLITVSYDKTARVYDTAKFN